MYKHGEMSQLLDVLATSPNLWCLYGAHHASAGEADAAAAAASSALPCSCHSVAWDVLLPLCHAAEALSTVSSEPKVDTLVVVQSAVSSEGHELLGVQHGQFPISTRGRLEFRCPTVDIAFQSAVVRHVGGNLTEAPRVKVLFVARSGVKWFDSLVVNLLQTLCDLVDCKMVCASGCLCVCSCG